ncbi:MAG: serine acetyltransferase [Candidatus Omnitrophica bacterium]|nr:serine acetyltransferase [Candidatus Omnitrophota bacterium]
MIEQILYFKKDLDRWDIFSLRDIFYTIFELGLWATLVYRLSRFLFLINIPIIKWIFRLICMLLSVFSEMFLGVRLPANVDIGPGLYIGHVGTVIFHHKVKMGMNCNVSQGVTIGQKGEGHDDAVPTIGDNVYIGAGAKVIGGIKVGNNVWIGANAVVLKDIPDNATAVGVPAIIKKIRKVK